MSEAANGVETVLTARTGRAGDVEIAFHLGRVVCTVAALRTLGEYSVGPLSLIARHAAGDWGEVSGDDKALNDQALLSQERLVSAYLVGGTKFYVITEADRSATTILLEEEY